MKTKLTIILSALLLSAAFTINAQQIGTPAIKILPTKQKEVLKVLYAYSSEEPVDVKFYNEDGLILTDRIKGNSFDKGFTRRYNLYKITVKSFWVEVSSADLSVTYKMTESGDGRMFLPFLEKTVYNKPLVASNN